ncbi:hypothetical protein LWC34_12440 [Kibdelosporangium philippinense]|uniref:Transcriptional repressor NrdR-like N-terminal domain-containing protein n=1 Tax=Kibdelosporangium philippinense TaxID=211113 RepID=A0ABS8Z6X0_9PSEU|nr:hypothetical protein [Kibdelosporangium philippinense]MCE7003629.1 hypothetical protein [Kibdelosporangium philippinense]
MRCPFCRNADSRVVDSREVDEGQVIRRRRSCTECGRRFTTVEEAILGPLRELDEVTYLRFASVYHSFDSADDFAKAIDELRANRHKDTTVGEETPTPKGNRPRSKT